MADELIKSFKGSLLAGVYLVSVSYVLNWDPISRHVLGFSVVLMILTTLMNRALVLWLELTFLKEKHHMNPLSLCRSLRTRYYRKNSFGKS